MYVVAVADQVDRRVTFLIHRQVCDLTGHFDVTGAFEDIKSIIRFRLVPCRDRAAKRQGAAGRFNDVVATRAGDIRVDVTGDRVIAGAGNARGCIDVAFSKNDELVTKRSVIQHELSRIIDDCACCRGAVGRTQCACATDCQRRGARERGRSAVGMSGVETDDTIIGTDRTIA